MDEYRCDDSSSKESPFVGAIIIILALFGFALITTCNSSVIKYDYDDYLRSKNGITELESELYVQKSSPVPWRIYSNIVHIHNVDSINIYRKLEKEKAEDFLLEWIEWKKFTDITDVKEINK